jgi:hypothetical protein
MKKYNFNIKSLAILLLISQTMMVEGQVRKYSNEFLKIGVGAKYLSTGGAMITNETDPSAVFYNPGSVGAIDRVTVSAMHNAYFAGIANFDYGGIIFPFKDRSNIGLSLIRFGVDNIPNTIQLYNPDGSINYDKISSFSISDMALFLSFGKRFADTQGLSIGGNVKIIKRDYGSFANAWGFGIDLGAQYITDKYKLGVFLQDVTTTYSTWKFSFSDIEKEVFKATNNEIPSSSTEITLPALHFGGQYNFKLGKEKSVQINPMAKLTVFAEQRNVLISGPISLDAALGGELGLFNLVFIRMGLNNFTSATDDLGQKYMSYTPSLGAGFKIDQFEIDYSYNNVANAGVGQFSHVFSAVYKFKKKDKYSSPTILPNIPNMEPTMPANEQIIPVNPN